MVFILGNNYFMGLNWRCCINQISLGAGSEFYLRIVITRSLKREVNFSKFDQGELDNYARMLISTNSMKDLFGYPESICLHPSTALTAFKIP
jgi:hypothetical protein